MAIETINVEEGIGLVIASMSVAMVNMLANFDEDIRHQIAMNFILDYLTCLTPDHPELALQNLQKMYEQWQITLPHKIEMESEMEQGTKQ